MADLKRLEKRIIASMRACISNLDTDHGMVRDYRHNADDLFADHLLEWSEAFAALYEQMLTVYRVYYPAPSGHWHISHIGLGWSSFETRRWIDDKIQPPRPTATELVERFDSVVGAYASRETEAA